MWLFVTKSDFKVLLMQFCQDNSPWRIGGLFRFFFFPCLNFTFFQCFSALKKGVEIPFFPSRYKKEALDGILFGMLYPDASGSPPTPPGTMVDTIYINFELRSLQRSCIRCKSSFFSGNILLMRRLDCSIWRSRGNHWYSRVHEVELTYIPYGKLILSMSTFTRAGGRAVKAWPVCDHGCGCRTGRGGRRLRPLRPQKPYMSPLSTVSPAYSCMIC